MEATDTRRQLSLDQPIDQDGTVSFGSLLPAPAGDIELEDRLALPDLLDGLGELERQAVVMRFFQDLKQAQTGIELGYAPDHRRWRDRWHTVTVNRLPADPQPPGRDPQGQPQLGLRVRSPPDQRLHPLHARRGRDRPRVHG
jgi:hypothetical protein